MAEGRLLRSALFPSGRDIEFKKKWKERYFILVASTLSCFEKAGSSIPAEDFAELDVSRVRAVGDASSITGEKCTFFIEFASASNSPANAVSAWPVAPGAIEYLYVIYLKASTDVELDIWTEAISDAMEVAKKKSRKPTIAKNGSQSKLLPATSSSSYPQKPSVIIFDFGSSDLFVVQKPPVYDGEKNLLGERHGQGMLAKNGFKYVGQWNTNLRHGQGKYTAPDGRSYEGTWKNDKPEGYGIFKWPSNEASYYEGTWINGLPDGYGKLVRADGSTYVGKWSQGIREGYGTLVWTTGDHYEGIFRDDVAHGYGRMISASGDVYEGQWFKGMMHGKGKYVWTKYKITYDGEFRYDECHGKATVAYPNGVIFNGEVKKNLRHGYGKLSNKSGKTMEGQWINDKSSVDVEAAK